MQRRVIGYARVNRNDEPNLERQVSQLQSAGALEVLSDTQSGLSKDRAGLNHLIALIQSAQVEEVVVTRIDRLSRSSVQLQQLLNLCRDKRVAITVLEQNLLFR